MGSGAQESGVATVEWGSQERRVRHGEVGFAGQSGGPVTGVPNVIFPVRPGLKLFQHLLVAKRIETKEPPI